MIKSNSMWYFINFIQYILIIIWTVFCAVLGMVLLVFDLKRQYWPMWVGRALWGPVLLKVCGVRLTVTGAENIDRTKPYIFAANHESNMDIPAVYSALPVNIYFIAKKELKKIPFMGWYMMAVGMIFIDRSDREKAIQSLQVAGEMIRNGKNVISFPEGTRSRSGEMGIFKRGTFVMSSETEIPIIPIAIKGAREVLVPGSLKIRPGHIKVAIGKPIAPLYSVEKVDDYANYVRTIVAEMRKEI